MTAADQFATLGDFDLIALPDVPAIMQAVQSRQGWGVIAWENNVEGYVVPNLDALIDAPTRPLRPDQCGRGLQRLHRARPQHLRLHRQPRQRPPARSGPMHPVHRRTPFAARTRILHAAACRDLKPGRVALGPSICGELYDLDTLAEHVQDFDGAHTEFLVIAPRDVVQELTPAPTAMTPATSKPSSPSSRWSPAPAYSPTCWTSCAMRD